MKRALVMELVGPACAGKTTLTRTLVERGTNISIAADISVRRPRHLANFVRTAPLLFPELLPGHSNSRWFRWEEIKSMVYVQGWTRVLTQLAANNPGVVLLDQGPVFRLALLHAFGPDRIREPMAGRWWGEMFQEWARFLDLVVWLDAPNPILEKRINARDRWHEVKGKSEQDVFEFLDHYRRSYRHILTVLSANGGPRVICFDTSQTSIDDLVGAILAACNVEPYGD